MEIFSAAFKEGEAIPKQYTCDGKDVSPPLSWTGSPPGTQSFAIISDDPDAPMGDWVHWVLFNIPSDTAGLDENIPPDKILANKAVHGRNDFGRLDYGGPCPPSGTHRYFFKLYALDAKLPLEAGATKKQLLKAMEGHVLASAELTGKYRRQR